jgi:phosphatidate cytidylyltransferase
MGLRILTGAVLAVLTVAIIWHGGAVFFAVVLVLALMGLNEYYRMMKAYRPITLTGFVGVLAMVYCARYHTVLSVYGVLPVIVLLTFLLAARGGMRERATSRMAVTLFGAVYVGLGFSHLQLLRDLPHGRAILLIVVLGTWAGDTMAYFTGRYFGSTPMTPRLSPKKTWEGFAGGAIGTVLLVVFAGIYNTWLGEGRWLLLGLLIAVIGPIGDLFESLLKRDVNIKDAGRGMPGHGGILDRFDALLFVAIGAFYLLKTVFGV